MKAVAVEVCPKVFGAFVDPEMVCPVCQYKAKDHKQEIVSVAPSPPKLYPPTFTLELRIDHGWKPLQILGVRWDEEGKRYLFDATYRNDSGAAQLCAGNSRLLFCGRVVLEFAAMGSPFVIPPGMGLSEKWPLTM